MGFERIVQIGLAFGRIPLTIVLCLIWPAAHAADGPLEGVKFPVSPEVLAGLIQQADEGSLTLADLDPLNDTAKGSDPRIAKACARATEFGVRASSANSVDGCRVQYSVQCAPDRKCTLGEASF